MFLVPVPRRNHELARLIDDSFDRFFSAGRDTPESISPALDIVESQDAWTVTVDLPGVAKQDVKVSIEGNQVGVETQDRNAAASQEGSRVLYRERSAVRYARNFTLPSDVDQAESSARMEDGVLTLTLRKRRASQSAQLTIN